MLTATKKSEDGAQLVTKVVPKQYNQIVEDYDQIWNVHPTRVILETPTYLRTLGEIGSCDVLELACGEGYYTRIIKTMTTGRVVGLDISEG
jgi:ubiquinone/menaquinone biosynthesis C-methylase UbiE